jgi:hypothetical protein
MDLNARHADLESRLNDVEEVLATDLQNLRDRRKADAKKATEAKTE